MPAASVVIPAPASPIMPPLAAYVPPTDGHPPVTIETLTDVAFAGAKAKITADKAMLKAKGLHAQTAITLARGIDSDGLSPTAIAAACKARLGTFREADRKTLKATGCMFTSPESIMFLQRVGRVFLLPGDMPKTADSRNVAGHVRTIAKAEGIGGVDEIIGLAASIGEAMSALATAARVIGMEAAERKAAEEAESARNADADALKGAPTTDADGAPMQLDAASFARDALSAVVAMLAVGRTVEGDEIIAEMISLLND